MVQQQPSPQSYFNNPSPQNVASPQGATYYGQNPSPHNNLGQNATEQYYAQQAAAAAAQQQQVRSLAVTVRIFSLTPLLKEQVIHK